VHAGRATVDRIVDLGRAVIMPGLVNVHSHLELTALRGLLEGMPFARWLQLLTAARTELFTGDDLYMASRAGIHEGLLAGITTYGDATATGAPMRALVDSGARGIAYLEVFGPDPAQCDASMDGLRRGVEQLRVHGTPRARVGVSPHAPYTVSPRLFSSVARFAMDELLPVSVHVAESASEVEFVRSGTGDFADRLRQRGISRAQSFRSPMALLEETGLLGVRPLLVHAIHVDDEDLLLISASGSRIAHCPISNAKLGHGIAPLASMLASNIPVGLGTDSVASNNAMNVLAEARQAALMASVSIRRADALTATDAITLATLGGARALGLDSDIGSLDVDKRADIVAFNLCEDRFGTVHDPAVALVHSLSGQATAKLVLVDGEALVVDGVVQRDATDIDARMVTMAARLRAWLA
jgi:5-methylthioadenosine/S-adenosylhomocysteine deaminase